MTVTDVDPEELRGLALSIHRLFESEPPAARAVEGEAVDDEAGGDDVAWVAEAGVRLPGDDRPPDPLLSAVRAYLHAGDSERAGARAEVERAAADARSRRDGGVLADAVEALAIASTREPDALELARSMVTPGVATLLAARVPEAAHDEDRRAELVAVLPGLGGEMALAILEALKEEALDGDADRAIRRTYLAIVSAMADDGSDILVRMMEDANWRIVRNAIHLIGERGEADAALQLKRTAEHGDPRVRKEALIALSKIGGEEAGVVAKMRLEDEDAGVRAQAARTVGVLKVELALRPLLALVETESDTDVMVEAIRSLGILGDPAAVPELERKATWSFFSRTKQPVRVAAYRALGAIGSPHALELVERATEDRDAEVRHTAETILAARAG